jgi:hypothetical protein
MACCGLYLRKEIIRLRIKVVAIAVCISLILDLKLSLLSQWLPPTWPHVEILTDNLASEHKEGEYHGASIILAIVRKRRRNVSFDLYDDFAVSLQKSIRKRANVSIGGSWARPEFGRKACLTQSNFWTC